MKLPIKRKFLDDIKAGTKRFELRDAHITLVCEEDGEQFPVNIVGVRKIDSDITKRILNPIGDDEFKSMFDDETQIMFLIESETWYK